jgi:hypothetical protein
VAEKEQELVQKFDELILTLPDHELIEILGCSDKTLYRLRNQIRYRSVHREPVQYKGVINLLLRYLL